MPSLRSSLACVVFGVLCGAGVAEAQTAPNLTMKLRRKVDETRYTTFNTDELREFFNAVSCVCGRVFGVEMVLTNPTADVGTDTVEIWVGSNCAEFSTERDKRCEHLAALDRPVSDFRRTVTIDIDASALMFPNAACASLDGENTVWALIDQGRNGSYEFKFNVTPVIAYDAEAPPAPTELTASGVEDAVALKWKLPTTTTDIRNFQVYCASAKDGSPLFVKAPGEQEFDRVEDVAGCSGQVPSADAGVPVDAGGGDAGAKPQDMMAKFEALDPEYRCSGRLGGTSSSFRIDLAAGDNVKPLDPDEGVAAKLVVIDNARNTRVLDFPASDPPQPVRDGWEVYHDAGGTADGGFCFVATAVYGDYDHPYVRVLRELRDHTLASFGAGRAFIAWYYRVSPPMADWLRRHDVARALAAAALFPVVAVAWVWNLLGGAGVFAVALLVWAARRKLRRRRLAVAAALGLVALVAAARPASAQAILDESVYDEPKGPPVSHWAFEIKLGPYFPDVDGEDGVSGTPYADTFGDGSSLFVGLELERFFFHPLGQLGLALSIGHMSDSGHAFKQDPDTGMRTDERSEDKTTFRMFPLALSLVYRFTELSDRTVVPLVPYAKLGLSYYIWQITKGDGSIASTPDNGDARGGTLGWQASVGVAVRADRFDPDASRALTTELGVEHAGFFFELTYADVSGLFQENRLHVGDLTWTAGVNFEF